MDPVVVSEEQADLLIQIIEHPVEVEGTSKCGKDKRKSAKYSNGKKDLINLRVTSFARIFSRALPNSKQCLLHLTRCCHLILSTALFITIAQYGQLAHHWDSDGFSLLCFVMTISTVILVFLMGLRRFWDPSFDFHSDLPIRSIVRDACMFSVSLIGMNICREKDHVPCHLQDSLFFLTIPFCLVYLIAIRGKEEINNKNVKLIVMLASFMCLIFVSAVPQLAYIYSCRGVLLSDGLNDRDTKSEALWIIIYIVCISLLSFSLCGFWCAIQDHEKSGRLSMQWTVWFYAVSLLFTICLFWINLFPTIGGSESFENFLHKFGNTWVCQFTNTCAISANLGFYIALFWLLFMYLSNLLVYRFQGNPAVVVANASLAIPLLNIFYGMFRVVHSMIEFKSVITFGTLVSVITFPVAYAILSYYQSACVPLSFSDSFDIF